ncbi:DUF1348 domain-containing protein [Zymomonas mobilis subsp. mobilis ZM4 = ATCC 31821]|uniref:50S ribosomal protein L21 n=1 Tax=Zymomonas mobilis subsp. mobilis (strain ATCC 31821 / ZM4 / CP4) TaxID=264203 RepID=Q5NPJ1_ZYMMO|nr:nuclear transport factor 2 family protein [Zymomonas mobilis]AAV89369.1 protein of unknown function DUF1348 [Zymomonas mobilis subsp. mobilis ZM4 = ATCC 31821]AVZ25685.1 DUF1348 domain-containing protein [Zymomonas mobilis subsp. mobilis]AVZ27576.1 DUF1348 domain-containing protein [Zymomonas mobilis subsp. mobilis]AVZ42022.1 DUF1348 domain-containing protein [Zymomonas mobilis subsp. mobilis ZM4 = ATCC 31821]UBQ08492.1 nuclear transport factor 2 family protein [Zymomonas mobilis]
MNNPRPPFPPFLKKEAAAEKVRRAEDAWNSQNPEKIALSYTVDSYWRNRSAFIQGRDAIVGFLKEKWQKEQEYRLSKELWSFSDNRIAVRFAYEWYNGEGQWFRSYGNENWEFDEAGLMQRRLASINDVAIKESERLFFWPIGRRPDDHPSLSELGL